jgi:hypothetical protein
MFTRAVQSIMVLTLAFAGVACDKKADDKKTDDKKADDKADNKAEGGDKAEAADAAPARDPMSTEGVKEGDSCAGIDASEGLITCDGNTIIFCSSYSDYKWTVQRECDEGTTCKAEGKAATCQ